MGKNYANKDNIHQIEHFVLFSFEWGKRKRIERIQCELYIQYSIVDI